MTTGNVGRMETVTLSDRVDMYRVRKLPKATVRWPVPHPDHSLNGNGPANRWQLSLADQLGAYRVTQIPGRALAGVH